MIAITPSGTRMWPTRIPEGRSRRSVISPTGSGQPRHRAQPLGHRLHGLRGEEQPIDERVVAPGRARGLHVLGVRGEIAFSRSTSASAALPGAVLAPEDDAREQARAAARARPSEMRALLRGWSFGIDSWGKML
jgi:hypothetical protein